MRAPSTERKSSKWALEVTLRFPPSLGPESSAPRPASGPASEKCSAAEAAEACSLLEELTCSLQAKRQSAKGKKRKIAFLRKALHAFSSFIGVVTAQRMQHHAACFEKGPGRHLRASWCRSCAHRAARRCRQLRRSFFRSRFLPLPISGVLRGLREELLVDLWLEASQGPPNQHRIRVRQNHIDLTAGSVQAAGAARVRLRSKPQGSTGNFWMPFKEFTTAYQCEALVEAAQDLRQCWKNVADQRPQCKLDPGSC